MTTLIIGASRGIGAGLAEAYRARGEETIGTGRSVAAQLQLDVTQPASHAQMAKALGDRAIDLMICNAGIYLDKFDTLDTGHGADAWAQTFATNVTGVFLAIQTLLPNLERAENGAKIAIIASDMASSSEAKGGGYIYRASKAAVVNLGRNLAVELKERNIAVGIYHPGWVQTDMGGDDAALTVAQSVEGLVARIDALDLDTTGCFEDWDGRARPF